MAKQETIFFFKEGVSFRLNKQQKRKAWLKRTALKEAHKINTLNYIYCDDKYLLQMNKDYLHHNYYRLQKKHYPNSQWFYIVLNHRVHNFLYADKYSF